MKDRSWQDRDHARKRRIATGYTSLRVTHATAAVVEELLKALAHECRGADELIFELASAELALLRHGGSGRRVPSGGEKGLVTPDISPRTAPSGGHE